MNVSNGVTWYEQQKKDWSFRHRSSLQQSASRAHASSIGFICGAAGVSICEFDGETRGAVIDGRGSGRGRREKSFKTHLIIDHRAGSDIGPCKIYGKRPCVQSCLA